MNIDIQQLNDNIGFSLDTASFLCKESGKYIDASKGCSIVLSNNTNIDIYSEFDQVVCHFVSSNTPQIVDFEVSGITNIEQTDDTLYTFQILEQNCQIQLLNISLSISNNMWSFNILSPDAIAYISPLFSNRESIPFGSINDTKSLNGRIYSGQRLPEYSIQISDNDATKTFRPLRYGFPVLSMVSANPSASQTPLASKAFYFNCTPTFMQTTSPNYIVVKLYKPGGLDTIQQPTGINNQTTTTSSYTVSGANDTINVSNVSMFLVGQNIVVTDGIHSVYYTVLSIGSSIIVGTYQYGMTTATGNIVGQSMSAGASVITSGTTLNVSTILQTGLTPAGTPPSFVFYPEDNINNVDGFGFVNVFMNLNIDFDLPVRFQIEQSTDSINMNAPYEDATLY